MGYIFDSEASFNLNYDELIEIIIKAELRATDDTSSRNSW